MNPILEKFDIDTLDMYEKIQYNRFTKYSTKSEALQILINSSEGDYTQLSKELRELAELHNL